LNDDSIFAVAAPPSPPPPFVFSAVFARQWLKINLIFVPDAGRLPGSMAFAPGKAIKKGVTF